MERLAEAARSQAMRTPPLRHSVLIAMDF